MNDVVGQLVVQAWGGRVRNPEEEERVAVVGYRLCTVGSYAAGRPVDDDRVAVTSCLLSKLRRGLWTHKCRFGGYALDERPASE